LREGGAAALSMVTGLGPAAALLSAERSSWLLVQERATEAGGIWPPASDTSPCAARHDCRPYGREQLTDLLAFDNVVDGLLDGDVIRLPFAARSNEAKVHAEVRDAPRQIRFSGILM
jgi:hypothetical protein